VPEMAKKPSDRAEKSSRKDKKALEKEGKDSILDILTTYIAINKKKGQIIDRYLALVSNHRVTDTLLRAVFNCTGICSRHTTALSSHKLQGIYPNIVSNQQFFGESLETRLVPQLD
jgi:hypothetical protein